MSEIITIESGEAVRLDVMSAGFAYGFGLFETIKCAEGRLSYWEPHWARLQASAAALSIAFDFDEAAVLKAIAVVWEQVSGAECMIKLSLLLNGSNAQLFVYSRPMAETPGAVALKLEAKHPINPQSLLAGHKTHNYMENFSILSQARAEGFYDAVRMDPVGNLAETTIGNLFIIKADQLLTPSLVHGILPGVIRAELLRQCEVTEGSYYSDLIQEADAVFMTNSAVGILPVDRISGAGVDCHFESRQHPMVQRVSVLLADSERSSSTKLV